MTSITVDLPDHLVDALSERARRAGTTVSELLTDALEDLAEDGLEPVELSAEELDGLVRAEADIAAGRVRSHEAVMARLDAIIDR